MNGGGLKRLGTLAFGVAVLALVAQVALARSTARAKIYRNSKEEAPFALGTGPDYRVVGTATEGKITSARVVLGTPESVDDLIDWDVPVISGNGKKVTIDSHVAPGKTAPADAARIWLSAVFNGELSLLGKGLAPPVLSIWKITTMKTALTIENFSGNYTAPPLPKVDFSADGHLGPDGGSLEGAAASVGLALSGFTTAPASDPWNENWFVGGTPTTPVAVLAVDYSPPPPYKKAGTLRAGVIAGIPVAPPFGLPPGPPVWVASSR